MPLKKCTQGSESGWKWGDAGTCYPYTAGDAASEAAAKKKAVKQALAANGGKPPAEGFAETLAALTEAGVAATDDESLVYLAEVILDDDDCVEYATAQISACTADDGSKGYKGAGHDVCHAHDGTAVSIGKAKRLALADAMRKMAAADEGALETVDFTGDKSVEIMAEGGPYFGQGSPKDGDYFDGDYLQARADDTNAAIAAKELRSRLKLGHNKKQKLLEASGLVEDGIPSAGVLKNFRVVGESPKRRLVADVLKVPKKLAALVTAGAWPGRSVELRNLKSQTKKGTTWRVVDALGLLGEKAPAIRTLDDWLAFFGEGELAYEDADEVQIISFAAGDVVWSPTDTFEARRSAVDAALNPGPSMSVPSRYWVKDVTVEKALVCEYGSERKFWVVPYTYDTATGDATLAPSDEWVAAEEAWVEEASGYASRGRDDPGDTSDVTPKPDTKKPEVKLSDAQVETLAATFGIDEKDGAKRREAVEAKYAEVSEAVPVAEETPTPTDPPEPTTPTPPSQPSPSGEAAMSDAEVEVLKAQAAKGEQAFEAARTERRDTKIDKAITEGRLDPAKRELWQGFFDTNEEHAISMLAELPVNDDLLSVYGVDESGIGPEQKQKAETAMSDQVMAMFGLEDEFTERSAA